MIFFLIGISVLPLPSNNRFYPKFYETMLDYCEKLDGYFSSRGNKEMTFFLIGISVLPLPSNNRFYPKFYETMLDYCEKLDGYFSSRYTQDNNYFNDMALFLMCIKILPSLIIAITLCLDVFYFGVIKYFYKSLVLMLIPLGWICFVYILRDADKFNMETYREFFHSITVDFKNVDGKLHMEPTYTLKKELSETDEKTLVLEVCLYYRRELFLTTFDDLEYKRKKIYFILARLLINILFLSAWGYLVYYGLVLIVPFN